jgi:hypothetical protein
MSETTETTTPETTTTEPAPVAPAPTTKESAAAGMLATVAEKVKGANPEVQKRFIEKLVEKELDERVGLLDKAFQKRFTCLTELNKVNRPDEEKFDANGAKIFESYTKERLKAIKDAKEALGKVEGAIEKALAGDWSKVKETCK